MRILVLCKRQYTGKDLLDDRYGRLFELPVELAARGHEVTGLVWSYRRRGSSSLVDEGVRWRSVDAWPTVAAHWFQLSGLLSYCRPDVIWASSDALHAILAACIGRRYGLPTVIDLYDDYEAFGQGKLPGIQRLLRWACASADALTVVSHTLAALVKDRVPESPHIQVIGNGVPEAFCQFPSQKEARLRLGLPLDIPLVGTAGALDETRGIKDLFKAYRMLRSSRPEVRLVLAGPRSASLENELHDDIIDLGVIRHEEVAWLYSALDVGVVCNKNSAFAQACHPQKLVEMIACKLPVVAAAVGDTALTLSSHPQCLFSPGDYLMLAKQIELQLISPEQPQLEALKWSALAKDLEKVLQKASARN